MTDSQKVIMACFTGRANGFSLPEHPDFFGSGGDLNTAWNEGAYHSGYTGPAFNPSGIAYDFSTSILPPYSWGAIGQMCDTAFDPQTHTQCASGINQKLYSMKNAAYAKNEFYWKAHGHNCHDAAEDIATCVTNATPYMPAGCGFDAKIIVWDGEKDVTKALGDVYHSEVLFQTVRPNASTGQPEPVVCLAEAQIDNPSGSFSPACCSTNLNLFKSATIEDIENAFGSCADFYYSGESGIYPHLYDVANFRAQRQTGMMDVMSSYDRLAGVKALYLSTPIRPGTRHAPHILGAAYDKQGHLMMLNVR